MNSSMLKEPEPSKSSFLNRFPNRLISSASKVAHSKGRDASFPILAKCNLPSQLDNVTSRLGYPGSGREPAAASQRKDDIEKKVF